MKTWWALLLVPCLLAPVYYQGQTVQAVGDAGAPAAGDLPAAVPLTSPLLVTPTVMEEAPRASETGDKQVLPEDDGSGEVPARGVVDAVACVQGLGVMQDMAALAYQQTPASTYMGVMVASALARRQVLNEELPNLATLRKRLYAIRMGGTLRDQLLQTYVLLEVPCASVKGAGKVKEAPVVPRPR